MRRDQSVRSATRYSRHTSCDLALIHYSIERCEIVAVCVANVDHRPELQRSTAVISNPARTPVMRCRIFMRDFRGGLHDRRQQVTNPRYGSVNGQLRS